MPEVLSCSRTSSTFEACNMLIAIDERLYEEYNRDLDNVTAKVQKMVKDLNEVYQK